MFYAMLYKNASAIPTTGNKVSVNKRLLKSFRLTAKGLALRTTTKMATASHLQTWQGSQHNQGILHEEKYDFVNQQKGKGADNLIRTEYI